MQRRLVSRPSIVRLAVAGALATATGLSGGQLAHAQAFTEVKNGQVDYSKADLAPSQSCGALAASFRTDDIAEIYATPYTAEGPRPLTVASPGC